MQSSSHSSHAAMQQEHSDVNKLVSSPPTHVAKQNGSWFNPDTWQGGKVPGDNAKVLIKKGVSVSYDGSSDARLHTLDVDGKLAFATNKSTKMVIDTFVVSSEGKLEIGTKGNPVRAGAKTEIIIADNGPIDLKWDPKQLSRGLISHGDVQIHGQAKTSHLKVSKDPLAGDRTLTLESKPINWQVGDKIVLTGTRYITTASDAQWEATIEDEEVTIAAISGNKVTLKEKLKYNHKTPRGDLKAYVANQSRNIVIASEKGESTPLGQRGHTMFMHSDDIDIRYVEFKDLGRTSKRSPIDGNLNGRKNANGRYAAHIHRTGTDGDPAIMVGNVVDGSPGWGFTIHESSAILENNFAYDVDGGAFVTESGDETGAFRNNISIKTGGIYDHNEKSGVNKHDFARSGVGFWFAGRLFENEGNVAAGSRNAGMFYMHRGSKLVRPETDDLPFPDAARNRNADGKVTVDHAPIQGFKDNEVLASSVGLHVVKNFPQQNNDLRSVLDGFKGWEVEQGSSLQYTSHYTLNDFDLVGSKNARHWVSKGLNLQRNTQEMVFNNMTIDGFKVGIEAQQSSAGQSTPTLKDKGFAWIDLELKNNQSKLKNIEIPPDEWLTKADINSNAKLKFTPSEAIDLEVTNSDGKDAGYVQIKGTKTDSLGTIEMPFGNESLVMRYNDVIALLEKGHYTLPNGQKGAVFNEYFSDRVTGKTIRQPFVVTFKEGWWTKGSPNLGKLNPNSLGGAVNVELPKSKFQLSTSSIKPTTPITITNPITAPSDPITSPSDPITPPSGPTTGPTEPLLQAIASYGFDTWNGNSIKDISTSGRNNLAQMKDGATRDTGLPGAGKGLKLNGTGRAEIKNSTDINLGIQPERSLSFWFKADEITGSNRKQVLYEEGGTVRGLNAYLVGDDLYVGGWNQPTGKESGWRGDWIKATNRIEADKWHHVAFTLDGSDTVQNGALTAYLDGNKLGSRRGSQLWGHGDRVALGNIAQKTRFHDGIGSGSQGLNGTIDEVNIYNQVLSQGQVKELNSLFG
ncbi:MAG: G8 domain-containing protein [Cyanobacteria bacterium J06560_6]